MADRNDLYDVKVIVRSSLKLIKEIKDLLRKQPSREQLFKRTVFGPWLDILSDKNDSHMMHYVFSHQVFVPKIEDACPLISFNIGDNLLQFGRKEFCLITGFRFGKVSEKFDQKSPFCERLFPEKVTKKGYQNIRSLELLGVIRNEETWLGLSDRDAVRVCLLIMAELVFMGKEDRNCIPKHLVTLVEDFDSWNLYPWGEYMWKKFYKRTVNVVHIHHANHLQKKKENIDYYPSYNLYGFPFAFKIWILESFPNSREWWSKKDNILPRALAWSNVTKFEKKDYVSLFGPESIPNQKLDPTPLEQQSEWFIESIEFMNGLVDLDENVFDDVPGNSMSSIPSNNQCLLLENGEDVVPAVSAEKNIETHTDKCPPVSAETNIESNKDKQPSFSETNVESNKDQQPSLSEVLAELREIKKELALVKVDNERISKIERLLNERFIPCKVCSNISLNAVNPGLSDSANHPLSSCSRPEIDNSQVPITGAVIHGPCLKNDPMSNISTSHKEHENVCNPNANEIDANEGTSLRPDYHTSNNCPTDENLYEEDVPSMDICNDNVPNENQSTFDKDVNVEFCHDQDVNTEISVSANEPKSSCSGEDMQDGKESGHAFGCTEYQNEVDDNYEIPEMHPSDTEPMLDVLVQVACEDIGIMNEGKDMEDPLYEREPCTLDNLVKGFDNSDNVNQMDFLNHVDNLQSSISESIHHSNADVVVKKVDSHKFSDDFKLYLNDEEIDPNVSLNDIKENDAEVNLEEGQLLDEGNKPRFENVVTHDHKPSLASVISSVRVKRKKCGGGSSYVLRSAKLRKKKMSMSISSPFGVQPPTTPLPSKTQSRLDDKMLMLPTPDFKDYEEDVSVPPKVRSINELISLEAFVEELSRPKNCKRDKVTLPEAVSAYLHTADPPKYRFPWGYQDIAVDRDFWLFLACLDKAKKGWLKGSYIDLWVDLMWYFREPGADWAMVSPYFFPCCLGGNMVECYSNGVRYPVAWRDVEKVYFPINEPDRHWCLGELHITSGVLTFYDSLGWVLSNRRLFWKNLKRIFPTQLRKYLIDTGVLQSKGIAPESYEIKYKVASVVQQSDKYGDCGIWVCIYLYRFSRNLSLEVKDPLQTALAYREHIIDYFWRHKVEAENMEARG